MASAADPAARRAAALAAIEARQRGDPASVEASSSSAKKEEVWVPPSDKEDAETRKNFARLLDRGIVRDNGYRESAAAVETLLKIAGNIMGSSEEKYRSLKATNRVLKDKVLAVKGGHDYLIAMGFRTKTVDFAQTYVLSQSMKRTHELRLGAEVLESHLAGIQARADALDASKKNHKSEEAARVARALKEIDDDRDKVKSRTERERLAREGAERRKKQAEEEAAHKAANPEISPAEDYVAHMEDAGEEDDQEDDQEGSEEELGAAGNSSFPKGGQPLGK